VVEEVGHEIEVVLEIEVVIGILESFLDFLGFSYSILWRMLSDVVLGYPTSCSCYT